jgi:integrase/recombinase XerD
MPLKLFKYADGRSPNYYLRGTIRRKYIFESTGTADEAAAEEIRIKREGDELTASIHGPKAVATFMDALTAYVDSGKPTRFLGTYDPDTGRWDGLAGYFGGRRLASIGQKDLDAAAKALLPRASAQTRNRQIYTPFIAIWNRAAKAGDCDERKWTRPERQKGTRRHTEPTRRGTKAVGYSRAAEFVLAMSPAAAINATILFYTGMRPIELYCLNAADVDLEARWIVVKASKTGQRRGIPMHEGLAPLLAALKARGGPVARTHLGRPYAAKDDGGGQMKSAFRGARKRSGIPTSSPYTARHTVSTELVVRGVHPHVKDEILGHAVTDMSRHYTHVPQAPLIEAINRLPVPAEWAAGALHDEPPRTEPAAAPDARQPSRKSGRRKSAANRKSP